MDRSAPTRLLFGAVAGRRRRLVSCGAPRASPPPPRRARRSFASPRRDRGLLPPTPQPSRRVAPPRCEVVPAKEVWTTGHPIVPTPRRRGRLLCERRGRPSGARRRAWRSSHPCAATRRASSRASRCVQPLARRAPRPFAHPRTRFRNLRRRRFRVGPWTGVSRGRFPCARRPAPSPCAAPPSPPPRIPPSRRAPREGTRSPAASPPAPSRRTRSDPE